MIQEFNVGVFSEDILRGIKQGIFIGLSFLESTAGKLLRGIPKGFLQETPG